MRVARAKPADYDKAAAAAKAKAPSTHMTPVLLKRNYNIRKIFDNYTIIADIRTTDKLQIRIAAGTLDGHRYVVLREFYWHQGDGMWKPGKNGLYIPILAPFKTAGNDVPTIVDVGADFLDKFTQAVEVARTMPLADDENTIYIPTNYSRGTAIKAKEISNNEDL